MLLIDPYGRRLRPGDWGYEVVKRSGHLTLRILRPVPGRWSVTVKGNGRSVLAAFVRSPLQVCCTPEVVWDRKKRLAVLRVSARSRFAGSVAMSGTGTLTQMAAWSPKVAHRSLEWLDAAGAQLRSRFGELNQKDGDCSLRARGILNVKPVCVSRGEFLTAQAARAVSIQVRSYPAWVR